MQKLGGVMSAVVVIGRRLGIMRQKSPIFVLRRLRGIGRTADGILATSLHVLKWRRESGGVRAHIFNISMYKKHGRSAARVADVL